jgi:Ca-activated chloride channel family protein
MLAQEDVFRVDVRLVRLLVTVKDQNGQRVGSLERPDFKIYDNGAPQEVSVFERHTEQPLSISLLIDISASTAKDLKYEVESVKRFLSAVFREGNPGDRVRLYSFNDEIGRVTAFSKNMGMFDRELRRLHAEGGTSLYDALWVASRDLEDRDGRHVLVVVTDGGDTTSHKRYNDALEAAHRADAPIYAALVMPITNDAGRNIGGENALTTFAGSTGGKVFTPTIGAELDRAFTEILRDLRTQYLIGFYPKNLAPTRNRFHKLEVKLNKPELRAESRNGYYGDSVP